MDELKLDLEHCYGIRRLEHTFNFTDCQAAALYAPNGAMKSSLAKTFQDIADGKKSSDRMFADRTTKRVVVDESGAELDPKSILVVRPYDEEFGPGANTSTLLVNAALRKDYEKLNAGVEDAKKAFLAAMKEQSGSKRDLAAEISATFTRTENQFLTAVIRINDEIKTQSDAPFADIPYDLVFDPKVVEMLDKQQVQEALEDYVVRFNELIDQSTYFKRGTFTYYNAGEIAKALESNGFFDAAHSVRLNADQHVEITTKQQLEDLVKAEKEGIAADAKLPSEVSRNSCCHEKDPGGGQATGDGRPRRGHLAGGPGGSRSSHPPRDSAASWLRGPRDRACRAPRDGTGDTPKTAGDGREILAGVGVDAEAGGARRLVDIRSG